ncbi:MmgE/PrpD family protein [Labrys neptuniae]
MKYLLTYAAAANPHGRERSMEKLADFAEFISQTVTIPRSTAGAAGRAIYDLLGVAAAGSETQGGKAARAAARLTWGNGPATVWFCNDRLPIAGAAFVNSVYGSMLDLDDGHRHAAGHPGAAIVPAVLAVAQADLISLDRVLTAIAIGYEIGTRVSAARDFHTLRTTDTGQWCGYGVAAAVGWLKGLSPAMLMHAMAIAGHTASGQFATGWTRVGHTTKEGIAWATAGGIAAVELARAGFTGPIDLLDDPGRYHQARLTDNLGSDWAIEASYLKIYSACRWAHGPVDAVLALQARHGIAAASIEAIEIATFSRALTLINTAEPKGLEEAQYSIPFAVALAAVHGPDALLLPDARYLDDPAVLAVARRVTLSLDALLDPHFPAATPCRVTIRHSNGEAMLDLGAPRGEPGNQLTAADLRDKFLKLVGPCLGVEHAANLERHVAALAGNASLAPLFALLSADAGKIGDAPLLSHPVAI